MLKQWLVCGVAVVVMATLSQGAAAQDAAADLPKGWIISTPPGIFSEPSTVRKLMNADIDLEAGTLHIRRALQRSGGDAGKRRQLALRRRRLLEALEKTRVAHNDEQRVAINRELVDVRKALKAVKTTIQLVEPKSQRSRRTIALPAVTVTALRKHRVRQRQTRLATGAAWREQGFVFTTRDRHALRSAQPAQAVQGAAGVRRSASDSDSRSPAFVRVAASRAGRGSAHDHGDARTLADQSDAEHLRARPAGAATRSRRQDGRRALDPTS